MNPILALSVKLFACIIIGIIIAIIRYVANWVEKDDVLITKVLCWGVFPAMLAIAIFWLLRSVIFASLA